MQAAPPHGRDRTQETYQLKPSRSRHATRRSSGSGTRRTPRSEATTSPDATPRDARDGRASPKRSSDYPFIAEIRNDMDLTYKLNSAGHSVMTTRIAGAGSTRKPSPLCQTHRPHLPHRSLQWLVILTGKFIGPNKGSISRCWNQRHAKLSSVHFARQLPS